MGARWSRLAPVLVVVLLTSLTSGAALAGIDARMLRYPDVSETSVAFVYAGDIWIASKDGGAASRLSTPPGEESFPRFSPDGNWIAFSGNYDGNVDVYVMPATGGVPTRLTHHPTSDRVLEWWPDGGSILFASGRESGKARFSQIWRVSREGGMPEKLPVPYGEFGAVGPDGRTLAYMPISRDYDTWKRYRGGDTSDLWLVDLQAKTSRKLTDGTSNSGQPMWHGSTLYFLSDRDELKRQNLWAVDLNGGAPRKVTDFRDLDVRFPAIGPRDIVFEVGGRVYILDLATEKSREIGIDAVTDLATLRPQTVNVGEFARWADLSPQGKRAVVQARGELYSLPAEHGPVLQLARTSGEFERYPAWSPDGKEIAYWSDASGEYELWVRPADAAGKPERVTSYGPGYRYVPMWSPDGKRLAFWDKTGALLVVDRKGGTTVEIDRNRWTSHGGLEGATASWSPDSRWLAWSRPLDNLIDAVFLWDSRDGKVHQVTSAFYNDSTPVFDPDGKYLYFRTVRSFDPIYGTLDNTWIYANGTKIAAAALRRDVPSPVAPRNDVDKDEKDGKDEQDKAEGADEDKDNGKGKDKDKGKKKSEDDTEKDDAKDKAKPVEIDLDGLEGRTVLLPMDAGNYDYLAAVSGKIVYRRAPNTGSAGKDAAVAYWDLEAREEKTVVPHADGVVVSRDGKRVLVVSRGTWAIVDLKEDQKLDKPLAVSGLETVLDPRAEWTQIFNDAWRFERDFFYDPGMHGVDWPGMKERYGALLEHAVSRYDVHWLLGELIGELNSSHAYRGGGDVEAPRTLDVGLLGADFALDQGAFRIRKIWRGAPWDTEVRAPLDRPGLEVKEGDYVLAVNGVPLDITRDLWASFQGLGGAAVELTVNDKPTLEGARQILVETLTDDYRLRNLAWIESNRRKVDEASKGRVGYAYVPSTGTDGQTELYRMFVPQIRKEALIIDERFNNGGQIPDRFVELLDRPVRNYWAVRDGNDWPWPLYAHFGPKVMLINPWSGSGGDAFPAYFRQSGLGPLVGKRTWGGLIGISGSPELVDGGVVTVPTFSYYTPAGEWAIEGHGVDPDIEVEDDPALMLDGGDPQLDRAIAEALRLLDTAPHRAPARPAYPKR